MKMFVCVKQVPDPNTTTSKLDPATKRLMRSGTLVLDPGDESTISAAIKLRDTLGNSEIVAVSMGPSTAQEAMRRALAMGVDRAILITDPALAGSDALATARVLAAAIKKDGGADMILCSTESTDGYTGMVPAGIAEFLGLPQLTFAREIKVEASKAVVKRVVPTGYKTVESPLPAVVTIASGSFEAIYPTMKGIMGAKKKPFSQFALKDLGIDASQVGEAGARERVLSIGKVEARAAGVVVKDDGNGAQGIADFLQKYQLL